MENLNQAIAEITSNTFTSKDDILVRDHTPNILRSLGIRDLPMQMTATHLEKAIDTFQDGKHCHGISAHTMEMIPFAIIDPVFVFDSDKKNDAVVIVTDLVDDFGQPIMVCVRVCGYSKDGGSANFITSVYGKRKEGVIAQFCRAYNDPDGRLLYCNKAKLEKLERTLCLFQNTTIEDDYDGQPEYGDKGFMLFSYNAENAEHRYAKEK